MANTESKLEMMGFAIGLAVVAETEYQEVYALKCAYDDRQLWRKGPKYLKQYNEVCDRVRELAKVTSRVPW